MPLHRLTGPAKGKVIPLKCDHGRDDEVYAVVDTIRREAGRLDVLVNNAFQVGCVWVLGVCVWMGCVGSTSLLLVYVFGTSLALHTHTDV